MKLSLANPQTPREAHFHPEPSVYACSGHMVQVYKKSELLVLSVSEYLRLGFENAEGALIIARPELWQALKVTLGNQGINLDYLVETAQVRYISAVDIVNELENQAFPELEVFSHFVQSSADKIHAPNSSIRCYGEIVDILCQRGKVAEAMLLEDYWNTILENNKRLSLMCGYHVSSLQSDSQTASVMDRHADWLEVEPLTSPMSEESCFRKIAILEQRSATLRKQSAERLKIEEDLVATKKQLVQIGKLTILGELSAGIAHELNNPLAIIKGCVLQSKNKLQKFNDTDAVLVQETIDFFDSIDAAATRMSKIVAKVLLFARQQPAAYGIFNVNVALQRALSLIQKDLDTADIHVKLQMPDESLHGNGDADLLIQVFLNILSNARDAIKSKGVAEGREIAVKMERIKNFEMAVTIRDNGIGMDAETKEKVFFPFFTTKDVGKGTGLGLSISHGIIKDHKGTISCHSILGTGTTFRIVLPRV